MWREDVYYSWLSGNFPESEMFKILEKLKNAGELSIENVKTELNKLDYKYKGNFCTYEDHINIQIDRFQLS